MKSLFKAARALAVISILSAFVLWITAIAVGSGALGGIGAIVVGFGLSCWYLSWWIWDTYVKDTPPAYGVGDLD